MAVRSNIQPGLLRRPAITDWLTCLAALGVSLVAVALLGLSGSQPLIALAPFVALAIATTMWRFPTVSLYALFTMAVLVEIYPLGFSDALTERLGLWLNLSTLGLPGIPVSPAEILMVGGLLVWLARGLLTQTLTIHAGALLTAYGWYLLVVVAGLIRGSVTGGNLTIGLWEVRAQFYGALVFLLAINQLHSRRQIEALSWIFLLGTGFKGLQGSWRYVITLGREFNGTNLLEHEEAFFFPLYYLFLLLLFIFGGSRRQKWIGVLLLPGVILAEFANNRRASTGSLAIAGAALVLMLYATMPGRRLAIARGAVAALVLGALYTGAFWNSGSAIAQPIQAIKSAFVPTSRDASSNLYREQEDRNIMYAIRQDMLVGRGYGVEMENIAGMVILTDIDPFILYRPHNSILWIWWRTGLLGSVFFWIAMGLAIIRNCFVARTSTDAYVRRWAIFAVCTTIVLLTIGWWDMGLMRYRIVVYSWIILAAAEALARSQPALHRSPGSETVRD